MKLVYWLSSDGLFVRLEELVGGLAIHEAMAEVVSRLKPPCPTGTIATVGIEYCTPWNPQLYDDVSLSNYCKYSVLHIVSFY